MRYLTLAVLILSATGTIFADTLAISDGSTSFTYDTDTAAGSGNADWVVAGSDVSFSEAWFITEGGSAEEMTAGTFVGGGDIGTVSFVNGAGTLALDVTYNIAEFGDGSLLIFDATVTNLSAGSISGHLTNYFDYDLPVDSADDFGLLDDPGLGTDVLFAADDAFGGAGFVADRILVNDPDPISTGMSAGLVGAEIGDVLIDDILGDVAGGALLGRDDNGFVVGDFAGAGQWEFTLGVGESVTFFGDAFAAAVPEPSSFFAFCFVGAGLLLRRRRESVLS